MRYMCAPDIPFLDTVFWYGKQIAAALIIFAIVYGIALIIIKLMDKWG